MGGKHLKRLRAERAKVHLKKKKLLPKGQNITDTSFRAKKIVLVEQLKKVDENEPVSSWNLTLKDLISRLNHYNYMTRLNSLTGIKELITNHPQILEGPMLRTIITRLLELLIDVEHKIRATAINLLNDLFSRLPSHFLIPLYDLFNVHVGCAMTHRDFSIQQDSLKFIDAMVQHAPKAVEKNFSSLLQSFMRIISSYKYGHHSEVNFSTKSREEVEKSKVEMLRKFYQLLNIVYSKSKVTNMDSHKDFVEVQSKKSRFDLKNLDNPYKKISDLSKLFKVTQTHCSSSTLNEGSSDEYQVQVSAIVSLLLNTWKELAPDSNSNEFTSECFLSENIAQLLLIILQILLLLYETTASLQDPQQEHWFLSTFEASFMKSLMSNFPYLLSIGSGKSGQISDQEVTHGRPTALMSQNLILCYLYHRFRPQNKTESIQKKVYKFVMDALRLKNPTDYKILGQVVEVMIEVSTPVKVEEMLSLIVKVHESTSIPEYRRRLFAILTKIATSDRYQIFRQRSHLKRWINSLPDRLLQPHVPLYVVETILKVVSHESGREILSDIEQNALKIISELPKIRVEDKEEFEGRKLIGNILYRCENNVLKSIIDDGVLTSDSYPEKVRNYLYELFLYKIRTRRT